mmetsp:Transcript_123799/g.240970  ORF Transcript_123799/g.240970 Transcript_123799/m.240970 type:complete len:628 (-) Transcript_123799:386-2269(-)
MASEHDGGDYPIHLGLAYLFLIGYTVRTLFLRVRLPGSVGVILSGFAFSFFMQDDILQGRDHLQSLAFFLVLLTAGTEISLADLKCYIVVFATLPAALETLGIAAYAHYKMHFTVVEALVLGTTLFPLGDGLVIPKMSEFGHDFPGHPLPRLMFIWAPLEASCALTVFGILVGLAEPVGEADVNLPLLILANLLRIFATLLVGTVLGAGAGWFVARRGQFGLPFTGSTVEAYLFILTVALVGFGIGAEIGESALVPIGFSAGSLFQPELMVIIVGSMFAYVADPELLHNVEKTMAGVWVFGQLILFSMLGSRTEIGIFAQFGSIMPLLGIGLSLRFLGILVTTLCTCRCRQCRCEACKKTNLECVFEDALFCFLSTLPRATVQGALGPVPVLKRFFRRDPGRVHVRIFICTAARLYIIIMAIAGSILLDLFGPKLLQSAATKREARPCTEHTKAEDFSEEGWTAKERKLTAIHKRRATIQLASIEHLLNSVAAGEQPHSVARRLTCSSVDSLGDQVEHMTTTKSLAESLFEEDGYAPLVDVLQRDARASTRRRAWSASHLESRVHWDDSREGVEVWDVNATADDDDGYASPRDLYIKGVLNDEEDPGCMPVCHSKNGESISRDGDLL